MTVRDGRLDIEPERAVLLIVDFQERLAAVMPDEVRAHAERQVCVLIEAARRFALPVVVSEQYPRGLGPTVAGIEEALAAVEGVRRFEKVDFSVCRAPAFGEVAAAVGEERDQWIVAGMETHICVYQSARQLVAQGAQVHVPRDAVVSRFKGNWRVGLDLIARSGGVVTSTEVVVFDLLGRAGTDDFKALSRLIR